MSLSMSQLASEWLERAAAVSLEVTVLVVLALVASLLLEKRAPQLRYALWVVVVLRLGVPASLVSPIGLVVWSDVQAAAAATVGIEPATAVPPPAGEVRVPAVVTGGSIEPPALERGQALAWTLFVGWLLGVLVLVGRTCRRTVRQRLALDRFRAPEGLLSARVEELADRIGCRRCPTVRVAPEGYALSSPALFGLLRPVIVLPSSMAERWSIDELEPLLVHELVHYRRRDHWVNVLQLWVTILHFFNPLVWWANQRLRRERELVCDESVIGLCPRRHYLEAILRFAEEAVEAREPEPLAVPLARRGSALVARARRIATTVRPRGARRWATGFGLLLAMLAILVAGPRPRKATAMATLEPIRDAGALAALEESVRRDPGSVEERLLLAYSYYSLDPLSTERVPHVLWLIENAPRIELPAHGLLAFSEHLEPELHRRSQRLWRRQVERGSGEPGILRNAAAALEDDPQLQLELLTRGRELEPWNSDWAGRIGRWHLRHAPGDGSASVALAAFEDARALASSDEQRSVYLAQLSRAAYLAGENDRAAAAAQELLGMAATLDESHWNRGNAVHRGHTILGLVALDAGAVGLAKNELAASAAVAGSPQLNSFGPNMSLARRLLLAGEDDAVLDYFDRCLTFWKSPRAREKIARWTADIAAGELPDFGPHLVY